jgi:TetR/AcrR family transcriptional repressor of nem operon
MKVTREQAAAHRERILEAAGALFRQHGFDGIGLAGIMKRAGLTHGGFYGHFESKDDLAAETCTRILDNDAWAAKVSGATTPSLDALVRGYLSPRHRDNRTSGCLFAALGADVARQPRPVRRAFTEALDARVEAVRELLPRRRSAAWRRQQALATMAGLVGALILSRAVDDAKLSDEILAAASATLGRA